MKYIRTITKTEEIEVEVKPYRELQWAVIGIVASRIDGKEYVLSLHWSREMAQNYIDREHELYHNHIHLISDRWSYRIEQISQ